MTEHQMVTPSDPTRKKDAHEILEELVDLLHIAGLERLHSSTVYLAVLSVREVQREVERLRVAAAEIEHD